MMKKVFFSLSFIFFLISWQSMAQEIFKLTTKDIVPGQVRGVWIGSDSLLNVYHGENAGIFYEYGFKRFADQDVVWRQMYFKVDIYEMKDSTAAFGIFSYNANKCTERLKVANIDCIDPYRVQFVLGNYYINIANKKGTPDAMTNTKELASRLVKKFGFTLPCQTPSIFSEGVLKKSKESLKFFRGPLGINDRVPELAGLFKDFRVFEAWILPVDMAKGSVIVCEVKFAGKDDMESFVKKTEVKQSGSNPVMHYEMDGVARELVRKDPTTVVFMQSSGSSPEITSYVNEVKASLGVVKK